MWPAGFLGTSANLLMDIILIAVCLVPFIFYIAVRKVRSKNYRAHAMIQTGTFAVVLVAVIAFELSLRLEGPMLLRNEYTSTFTFKALLYFHIAIATLSYAAWGHLIYKTVRTSIPGKFSAEHKKRGKQIFIGASLTSLTGALVYVFTFAL